jgi:hypothetical protein
MEDDEHVFDEGDEGEGVDDEGESSQDVSLVGELVRIWEGAVVDIERGCADIAIHHSEALKGELQRQ